MTFGPGSQKSKPIVPKPKSEVNVVKSVKSSIKESEPKVEQKDDEIVDDYNFDAIQNSKAAEIFNSDPDEEEINTTDNQKSDSKYKEQSSELLYQAEVDDEEAENDFEEQKIEIVNTKTDSPMLDKTTKDKLINMGQSLDSKQLTQALGFIDLKVLLRCFAKAVMKHINYSQGYLFVEGMLTIL